MAAIIHDCGSETDWAREAAQAIAQGLTAALARRPRVLLTLPGGSTPAPVLARLSAFDIDWSRVDLLPSDERWVPPTHADSNERLIRAHLLTGKAGAACLHALYRPTARPSEAVPEMERALAALPLPIDVSFLGMGEDGHVASLFPGHFDEAEEAPLVALDETVKGWMRLSLSLSLLAAARTTIIAIRGAAKRRVVERALAGDERLPIARLLARTPAPAHIHWME